MERLNSSKPHIAYHAQSSAIAPSTAQSSFSGVIRTAQESRSMDHFWIAKGWYKRTYDGSKELTKAQWSEEPSSKREAVRFLVNDVLHKDPRDITANDLKLNKLHGLIAGYYGNSPYAAVSDAFPELEIRPWEMIKTPLNAFKDKQTRVLAVRWLCQKLAKDPRDLSTDDFDNNRLAGLSAYYNESPYNAVLEAFADAGIKPWEMAKTPKGFYDEQANRAAAIKWQCDKSGKLPQDMTWADFKTSRIYGLLAYYYNSSPYAAISEAFPELALQPYQMSSKSPRYAYHKRTDRILLIKQVCADKDPATVTIRDFDDSGFGWLLAHYKHNVQRAIQDAFPELIQHGK